MIARIATGLAFAAALATASCSRSQETPVRDVAPPTTASASPAPATSVAERDAAPRALPPIEGPPARTWTDPRVVARLAEDCRADVTSVAAEGGMPARPNQVLTCDGWMFEQACVSDPCLHEDERTCRTECSKTCGECQGSCTTSCDACKSRCAKGDRACHEACGQGCGQCHADCLAARDRCSSGHCAKVYADCRQALAAKWRKNRCDDVCKVFVRCADRCNNPPPSKKPMSPEAEGEAYEACRKRCQTPAVVTCGANEMLCGEMQFAPELGRKSP